MINAVKHWPKIEAQLTLVEAKLILAGAECTTTIRKSLRHYTLNLWPGSEGWVTLKVGDKGAWWSGATHATASELSGEVWRETHESYSMALYKIEQLNRLITALIERISQENDNEKPNH